MILKERETIVNILKTLGSETRLLILEVIMNSPNESMTTTEISKKLSEENDRFNTAIVSKEISILKNKGILEIVYKRGANKYYRISTKSVLSVYRFCKKVVGG